jgi:hypothetical protein
MTAPLVFVAVFSTLYAAHQVGDHWLQSSGSASHKGMRRREALAAGLHPHTGPRACAVHVATYTATAALFLAAVVWRTHLALSLLRLVIALSISAVSHYWADRRYTLRWLCQQLDFIGKDTFYTLGQPRAGHDDNPTLGTGAYALDQSFHILFLFLAALIAA